MDRLYPTLADALADELFPEVDTLLRRGVHLDETDARRWHFLNAAEEHLAAFYARYGARLVRAAEGYAYLLPGESGALFARRHLAREDMLVGLVLALLRMDPHHLQRLWLLDEDTVLLALQNAVGRGALAEVLSGRKRAVDEETGNREIREAVGRALSRLARLGFIDRETRERVPCVRLRKALYRFAEPFRDGAGQLDAARLAARGVVMLGQDDADSGDDADDAA
ncbi:condensin subunit MukE [Plasticicumulans lactativorans]|uniref:Condensin subunit MukE n=1 Tax=Plasticicumulans lactativorans TaxID=1133106 RepID=A0A4R2LSH2_9GAMM|nr:chromosome partition protein MukE [Plasticicumulans lactativorans]TCO82708.1 condensin subunit MukE [Plasticicumulans lactativorans]